MTMNCKFSWMLTGTIVSICCVGCDLGTYGRRYEARVAELERRSELVKNVHLGANTIADSTGKGTGISMRLPSCFDGDSVRFDPKSNVANSKKLPLGIAIPGYTFSFEKFVDTATEKQVPVYTYIATVPVEGLELDALKQQLGAAIGKVVQTDRLSWESVELDSLSGPPAQWQRLKLLVAQPFDTKEGKKTATETMDGHLQFFLKSFGSNYLIVALRVPAEVEGRIKFGENANGSFIQAVQGSLATAAQ